MCDTVFKPAHYSYLGHLLLCYKRWAAASLNKNLVTYQSVHTSLPLLMTHTLHTRTPPGVQWWALKRDHIAPLFTVFVSWLCVQCRTVSAFVRADPSQLIKGNNPTSTDLIRWGIYDLVMLPSETCPPLTSPAAVGPDRWSEIIGRWGDVGALGDPGLCCSYCCCVFL